MRRIRRDLVIVACGLLLGACGDSGDDQNNNSGCPEGLELSGPACVPIFDDCPGSAEISVLGGGCQQVGVVACAPGLFVSDGDGGCEPILPDQGCPDGTMEVLGLTACQPVGVTGCAAGFVLDGEGGCSAILPPGPDPCPSGTVALLGYNTCQPLGNCGTGTWGNIATDGTTVFVDQTADATGADGSQQAPFVTVGEALAVVVPGGQIAVAAGDYSERLNINQEVRLTGRCAELVTIRGRTFLGDAYAPLNITAGGAGTSIRGVTLTGPASGLVVTGAAQVVVEQVQVRDASGIGVDLFDGSEVSLQQVVVTGCGTAGVMFSGSSVVLAESVVQDTRSRQGTQRYGRGIEAQCSSNGACGSLRVVSSLVSGNRDSGIYVSGPDAEVSATVVRDTLPLEIDGTGGQGINAHCNTAGACGSVQVSSSLISGNRDNGVLSFGVDAELTDTVVRDTLPQESDLTAGWGINAQCYSASECGSLRVSSSLIKGNRDVGIFASGLGAEIIDTVVRDTLAEESTGRSGRGINVQVASATVRGSLWVESSLVWGNRDIGIMVFGADTEITSTVVRDTLAEESTGTGGRGLVVQCDPAFNACGSLQVFSSIVYGNTELGIQTTGFDAEITSTVVRDSLPNQLTGLLGHGIATQCYDVGACGSLRISSSIVANNRDVGIASVGVDTEVSDTVVRDTLPDESDGTGGRGITVQCYSQAQSCGSLRVSSSLVSGSREVGILAIGVDTEVTGTVVRDTLGEESTRMIGHGIGAQCYPLMGLVCGTLLVSSSLVSASREVGIIAFGVDTEVTATVVRDTLPQLSNGWGGRGINAQCYPERESCGSLRVSSSLVSGSENVGIFIAGVPSILERSAVIDTQPNAVGPGQGVYGQGIWAVCDRLIGSCSGFSMTSCLVDSSHGGGLAVEGISGFIASSAVHSVTSQPLDGKYGYGVQIGGIEGFEMPTFNVNDCDIQDAKLAGILYYRARGALARSVVGGAENSVVMNEGSELTILDGNDLSGTVENEPTWANLYPCPAPAPAMPSDSAE
ncbi:MAG: right-handed parallel beta-helix repeat-containing protein [bacterium]